VLEDDTPELVAEEAIEGENLKIEGAPIETTTTNPERAQEGDSGEVDRCRKRPTTRRHVRRRGGGVRSLRRWVEAHGNSGDLCGVGVAWSSIETAAPATTAAAATVMAAMSGWTVTVVN